MARNKFSLFIYALIGLAFIGLISQLLRNTAGFLSNIFMMLGFGIAIFAVIYFLFLRKGPPSSDMKKYRQAVKQSKSKYKASPKSAARQQQPVQAKKRKSKRASHLHVIDGNKH